MKGSSLSCVASDLKTLIRIYEIYSNEICDNYG